MLFDASTDAELNGETEYDYSCFWIKRHEASGFTGDVNITLPACTNGDTATVVCEWIKVYRLRSLNG